MQRSEEEHKARMRSRQAAQRRIVASRTAEKGLLIVHTGTVSYTHLRAHET